MNYLVFNYVTGITSVLGPYRPFREVVRESAALARRRANDYGIPPELAHDLNVSEFFAGQTGFAVLCLAVIASILALGVQHGPQWIMCLLALIPGTTLFAGLWLERWLRGQLRS